MWNSLGFLLLFVPILCELFTIWPGIFLYFIIFLYMLYTLISMLDIEYNEDMVSKYYIGSKLDKDLDQPELEDLKNNVILLSKKRRPLLNNKFCKEIATKLKLESPEKTCRWLEKDQDFFAVLQESQNPEELGLSEEDWNEMIDQSKLMGQDRKDARKIQAAFTLLYPTKSLLKDLTENQPPAYQDLIRVSAGASATGPYTFNRGIRGGYKKRTKKSKRRKQTKAKKTKAKKSKAKRRTRRTRRNRRR